MKLIFSQPNRQKEPAVTENADADSINNILLSTDWSVYTSIRLEIDNNNFMEIYGTDDFGLEIMAADNERQLVSLSPINSQQDLSIMLLSYFRQDGQWGNQIEWKEKDEACCGIPDDFSLTKFICTVLFFPLIVRFHSIVFRCKELLFAFKIKLCSLSGIRPAIPKEFDLTPEQDAFLGEAIEEHNQKNDRLRKDWGFGDYEEWGFEQITGNFFLRLKDGKKVTASGQVYGSLSTADKTWEWAWNNPNVEELVKKDSFLVREYGEKQGQGFQYLCLGLQPIPHVVAPIYFAAIAEKLSGAQGVFPAEYGNYTFYIGLKDLKKE